MCNYCHIKIGSAVVTWTGTTAPSKKELAALKVLIAAAEKHQKIEIKIDSSGGPIGN